MSKVIVIGGGAAGMMAAIAAAEDGHQVTLLEKNEKLGKKIYITGKGRCNLTNNCDVEDLLEATCVNQKFLYSAFHGFTSQDTIEFFENSGMKQRQSAAIACFLNPIIQVILFSRSNARWKKERSTCG